MAPWSAVTSVYSPGLLQCARDCSSAALGRDQSSGSELELLRWPEGCTAQCLQQSDLYRTLELSCNEPRLKMRAKLSLRCRIVS